MEFYATSGNFNGTVLVARKGTFLLAKGYGYQDVAKKIKNTEKTIFQVGHITMQFTAELLLLLDSQGKLGLDDKVSKYLPNFPNGDKITLKNLLTHTSGLYDYTSDTTLFPDPVKPVTIEQLMGAFQDKPLAFTPGEQFQFTNANYVVLGKIIDSMTRWSYEDQLRYKVLKTCGMYNSGFDFTDVFDNNKAKGYCTIDKDTATEAPIMDSSLTYAGSGLYTTATDLYKWHHSLLAHTLLPKDWQEIAYTPYKNHTAFGWEVETLFQRKFLQQSGSVPGFSSLITRQENDDVVIVLLQNKTQPADVNKIIANNIIRCLYDKDYRIPSANDMETEKIELSKAMRDDDERPEPNKKTVAEKVVPIKTEAFLPYIGEYVFDPAFTITISHKGNDLYAQAGGSEAWRLQQESNTLFYKAGLDSRVEFVKDTTGTVNRIILHHHTKDEEGLRKTSSN